MKVHQTQYTMRYLRQDAGRVIAFCEENNRENGVCQSCEGYYRLEEGTTKRVFLPVQN
jgi:hypothetical protein